MTIRMLIATKSVASVFLHTSVVEHVTINYHWSYANITYAQAARTTLTILQTERKYRPNTAPIP